MKPDIPSACWIALLLAVSPSSAPAQTSTAVIVESVNDYGPNGQLPNSIANGDGFMQNMVFPGSRWTSGARYTNSAVYDRDFVDVSQNAQGLDQLYFDRYARAAAYFTGHGITHHGCSTVPCTTTATCTRPETATGGGVARMPGTCRFSPMDAPRCCYMVDRQFVTYSPSGDRFGGLVNYTRGPVRFGESPQSGGWAGAGTDGGANLVVLDISHGILPPFWAHTLVNANAGIQLIATLMTAGGDTANVPDRGSTFSMFYRANENTRVSTSWVQTMNSLPANEGGACPGGGGGHGFNGCGCNIIVGMDNSPQRAAGSMTESWVHLSSDSNDALGNQFYEARWVCNYPLPAADQRAWELP
ncbi:hypothetical protein LY474_18865 [Myxococcus stipitatus]|uniref:hypothetical protein n=1 Tax=Myxococcus stipitatus TaxID=83455 RepID=UPI001F41856A|nr:hypothetical protein [Myxococcus stipitatus]MCE9669863.1 hypothetical protein [Myxococcus stipitatus]